MNRVLPDFLIIGTQKGGTTSLHNYLSQHPDLIPSLVKEVHFFDGGLNPAVDTFKKGEKYYRAFFSRKKDVLVGQKTFETSPLYLFNPLAPKRMHKLVPGAKLIIMLRNPTDRAISHYFHSKRKERENLPLLEAFINEEKRIEKAIKNRSYKDYQFIHFSYKRRGLYWEQIARYLQYFSREQILLIKSEEFYSNTKKVLEEVFSFLDVDNKNEQIRIKAKNTGGYDTEISEEVYDYLNSYFASSNRILFDKTGMLFE